ncbi:MAG: DUF58 domain-containing protein [Nitrososphaerota archaeon]
MLTREGALLLISLSGWIIFISTLLYHPFIFLASFFLQTFFTTYILLANRKLRRLDFSGLKVERAVEPQRTGDKTRLKVTLVVKLDGEGRLYIQAIERPPYGTHLMEGSLRPEGAVGDGQTLSSSYVLEVSPSMGLVRFGKITLRIHDPLRLCYVSREMEGEQEVFIPLGEQLVGAVYGRLRASWIRPPMGLGFRGLVGYDDEFSGVKSYELGDRIRDIHWMRYAQQVDEAEIVAKKYVKKGEVTLHIVVDCSPSINAGEDASLVTDISTLLRRLCQTAEEEGNPVQFWLINPELNQAEKVSHRRLFSRVAMEQYIARVFPSRGKDDGKIAEAFSRAIKGSSVVFFIVNPPSPNVEVVEDMIETCREAGARYVICVPDMSSYFSSPSEQTDRLLELDRFFKDKWVSRFKDRGSVIEIRKGFAVDITREALRRGSE